MAGRDENRAADLNAFFARSDIDAIICARGGYGSLRLLSRLDWGTIRDNPKIFVGYSDVTSLHLGIARHGGFISFHGPMAAAHAKLNDAAKAQFWRMLECAEPQGLLAANSDGMQTIVPGMAEGELAGGCLSLMAHSCGSDFAPDFVGKIVLIEDVGEAIYRADRSLWQLRNTGAFDRAAGFVIGTLTNWRKQEVDPPLNTQEALFEEFFGSLGAPTIVGFPFGHEPNPLTLPLGVRAQLDADNRTLTLMESGVV